MNRTYLRMCSAVISSAFLFFSAGISYAADLPEAPSGLQEGTRGEDFTQDDSEMPDVLTQKDINDIRNQQERERALRRYEQYLDRLEDLGVGQNGGGGGSSSGSSGSSGSSDSGSSGGSSVAYDGGGAKDPVKGAGEHGVPEDAGVGAPNAVAFAAVQESARISATGPYPYTWGGSSPEESFDCSGFTGWIYSKAGLSIPNVAQAQDKISSHPEDGKFDRGDGGTSESAMVIEKQEDLLPGDLLVWKGGEPGGHVGIILTVGAKGDKAFQESGDPNSMGPFRTENLAGQSFMMVRPTFKENGDPVIPEAKAFPKDGEGTSGGDEDKKDEDKKDEESPSTESETGTKPEDDVTD